VEKLALGTGNLVTGDGMDGAAHVRPCVSKTQQERVLVYMRIGKEDGTTVAAEGKLQVDPATRDGFLFAPTLLIGVTRVLKEETLRPIVTVTTFKREEEAVALTHSSSHGLTSVIFTKNAERSMRVARQIDVGMVWINNYFREVVGCAFGGMKDSGHGREHCFETLLKYTAAEAVRTPSSLGKIPA